MNSFFLKTDSVFPLILTPFVSFSRVALVCLLFFAVLSGYSQAQSTFNADLSDFSHGITHLTNSGDKMTFDVELGTPLNPAHEVAGYSVTIEFPQLNRVPDAVNVSISASWLGNSGSFTYQYHVATSTLDIQFSRSHQDGLDGAGGIAHVSLSLAGGFTPQEAQPRMAGGVVMVENMDFKGELPGAEIALTAYPNPTVDFLRVETELEQAYQLALYDLKGQVMLQLHGQGLQEMDLRELPAGTYLLIAHTDESAVQKRIVKR